MLWVPEGFAHGFLTLSESADFLYKCTSLWDSSLERCILWNDTELAIRWPLPVDVAPRLSPKDTAGSAFRSAEYLP